MVTLWVCGCGGTKAVAEDPANAPHVAVVKVARQNLTSTLEIASELQPFQEIDVYAKVAGYIQQLNVDWGTHVKQGQVLAVLEIPELQQQVQQDEAAVRRSEQDLARAREELTRAQSAYTVAHVTYQRLADVQKTRPELVAQQEMDVGAGKRCWKRRGSFGGEGRAVGRGGRDRVGEGAAGKRQSHVRVRAHHGAVRWRGDAESMPIRERCCRRGHLRTRAIPRCAIYRRMNLLRLVIPVPERAVPDIRRGRDRSGGSVGAEKNVQREDRADCRIRLTRRRGRCTRN